MPCLLAEDMPDPAQTLHPPALTPHSTAEPWRPSLALPLPPLSAVQHFIPLQSGPFAPECGDDKVPLQLSPPPLGRLAGVCLNLNAMPDMYAEDGSLLNSELLMQLSPASAAQFGFGSPSPTTISALSTLRRFLPSNFDIDSADGSQYDMYIGDEFRMYEFKVKRCMRGWSHDWTECPYVHPGEKARRRDPRRYHYSGDPCADYRKGSCKKGDACEFAHGVFESWLHPTRYRTQPCKDGQGCQRRICFFAHTRDQLRVISHSASSSPCTSPSPTSICSACMETPLEAFELCGSSSSDAPHTLLTSSMFQSLSVPSSPLPLLGRADVLAASSLSPRSFPFDTALASRSTCEAPNSDLSLQSASTSMESCQPRPFSHGYTVIPTPNHMVSEREHSLLPSFLNGSSVSSAMVSSQDIGNLVGLFKEVDLAQHPEPVWQRKRGSLALPEWQSCCQYAWSAPATPTSIRSYRASNEIRLNRGFFDEEEVNVEPQMERVESGRGLRAQIFESLLKSASGSGS